MRLWCHWLPLVASVAAAPRHWVLGTVIAALAPTGRVSGPAARSLGVARRHCPEGVGISASLRGRCKSSPGGIRAKCSAALPATFHMSWTGPSWRWEALWPRYPVRLEPHHSHCRQRAPAPPWKDRATGMQPVVGVFLCETRGFGVQVCGGGFVFSRHPKPDSFPFPRLTHEPSHLFRARRQSARPVHRVLRRFLRPVRLSAGSCQALRLSGAESGR